MKNQIYIFFNFAIIFSFEENLKKTMEETPETLYQKTKEILDSGTKDRDALNNAVELSAKALKIQYVSLLNV